MKKRVSWLCVLVVLSAVSSSVLGYDGEPNELSGKSYFSSGTTQASGTCPSWFEALSRDGYDGGQLTIELDGCQIIDYEIFTRAQNAGPGYIADLGTLTKPNNKVVV
jgi:hypothetical protein